MKRASYREAIAWIALNDDPGSSDAYDPKEVGRMISSHLVADLFGVDNEKVGKDIVRFRLKVKAGKIKIM